MARFSRFHRLTWLALAATLAVVSMSREASAGTMSRQCAKMGRDCCCVVRDATLGIPAAVKDENLPVPPISPACQIPDCDCQADAPTPTASLTDRFSSDLRSDSIGDIGFESDRPTRPSDTCGAVILSHASPPRSPLYLQLSHLQI